MSIPPIQIDLADSRNIFAISSALDEGLGCRPASPNCDRMKFQGPKFSPVFLFNVNLEEEAATLPNDSSRV